MKAKILLALSLTISGFMGGAVAIYAFGADQFLAVQVERNLLNAMKTNAASLLLLRQGKQDAAVELLENSVRFDIAELGAIDLDTIDDAGQRQLAMLNSLHQQLADLQALAQ